jgi:glutaconate CoA-transferase, subunit A
MKSKLMSLEAAAALVPSGSSLTLSGAILPLQPMAFIYALLRRRVRDLSVTLFVGGNGIDLLVGAGAVRRLATAYAGLGPFGAALNVRRAVETGQLELEDMSESALMARFKAAGSGVPFLPTKALLGTTMAERSKNLAEMTCPFTGERVLLARAVDTAFTVIHAHAGDIYGNIQHPLDRNTDEVHQMLAKAAKTLIVTVERIIPTEAVMQHPTLTWIPHHWVRAVVEAPYGGHPGSVDGVYCEDERHLRVYAEASRSEEGLCAYLDDYVYGVRNHWEYLDKVGGLAHLSTLKPV